MRTQLLVIVLCMILYDFSLHLWDRLTRLKIISGKHPIGPWRYFGTKNGRDENKYEKFWIIYWLVAAVLVVLSFYAA